VRKTLTGERIQTEGSPVSDPPVPFKRHETWLSSMNNAPPTNRLFFRVHFMRIHGPESDPIIRVLLVETTKAQTIYEGFGTWPECRRWVAQISECAIFGDQFAAVEKRLEVNQLATISETQISLGRLEAVGFRRADS